MKKNNILKIVVFVILLTALGLGVYSFRDKFASQSKDNTSAKENEDKKAQSVKYKTCYVAQTGFTSYQRNIKFSDLKEGKIYTFAELGEELKGFGFGDIDTTALVRADSAYGTKKNTDKIMLIKPDESLVNLKTLYIDGNYFWDKENIAKYPLCFSTESSVKDAPKLYDYNGGKYDYDFASIKNIFAAGEVIPVRAVDRTWLNQTDNYTLLFDRYRERIEKSDLSIAMLENPISGNPAPCKGCMMFVGDERNAQGFKEVGFDAMGIGNHFGDGGQKALKRSIEVMSAVNIGLPGASSSGVADALKPYIMTMGDQKVAFLSADDVAAYYWVETNFGSNRYSKKSASGSIGTVDHDKIEKDISEAKKQADLVVVMVSWGVEYTNKANAHQQEMGRALIDAGADIIIGSHPHWVQQIEFYKGKPIIYSLGNFVFDQTSEGPGADISRQKGQTRQGMTTELYYVGTKLVSMDLIPHKMCGYDQAPGGEASNKTHNLAWKIQSGQMTYAEVDNYSEKEGCVWYQPTPLKETDSMYKQVWDRMMQYYGT